MQEDPSVQPSDRTLVALLKTCTNMKDLVRGSMLHATISELGLLEGNVFIGATLVDMYAKCGCLFEAQEVLDRLSTRDVVSWNALLSGYTEHAHYEDALLCFEKLQLEGIFPNAVTYVSVLKACAGTQAGEKGCEIHAEVARNGLLGENVFVGNVLVDMYARCGLLIKAQEVYERLPIKDAVSCNAMIMGYMDHGDVSDALRYLNLMEVEGITPTSITYICSLKAISKTKDELSGIKVHLEATKKGFLERDINLSNAVIDMYAKCAMISEAQKVLETIPCRDVVSYNTIITGYGESEHGEEAIACLQQMQVERIIPDTVTYICCLKACSSSRLIEEGQEVHAEITKKGLLQGDLALGNSLIDIYSKCGKCIEAHYVFETLPERDIVSWNTIIAGYAEFGFSEKGLECYEEMELHGVTPDGVTLATVIKACASIKALEYGQDIHGEILRKNLLKEDPFIGSSLVDMYIKCDELSMAQEVFDRVLIRDTVLWNALLAGYAEHERNHEVLNSFERMQSQGVASDTATLTCILKACCHVGAIDKGHEIHSEICEKGLEDGSLAISNAVVDMYAKCGLLEDAQKVLNKLKAQDVVSWNAIIVGYSQLGDSQMVFSSLNKMMGDGIRPDAVTLTSVLKACCHAALFDRGTAIYDNMLDDYGIVPTTEHQNCIIDLQCRTGHFKAAINMVQKMHCPSSVAWSSILNACNKWGNVELGHQAFDNLLWSDAEMLDVMEAV
ncbi:hypothetical protein KP509_03G039400 [Ceratopteris richardii]|nr:hypothetical protein KP509_03G039400 [Ceratopteris richardii]